MEDFSISDDDLAIFEAYEAYERGLISDAEMTSLRLAIKDGELASVAPRIQEIKQKLEQALEIGMVRIRNLAMSGGQINLFDDAKDILRLGIRLGVIDSNEAGGVLTSFDMSMGEGSRNVLSVFVKIQNELKRVESN